MDQKKKAVQFGLFWPPEDDFGPFESTNHTVATSDYYCTVPCRDSLVEGVAYRTYISHSFMWHVQVSPRYTR